MDQVSTKQRINEALLLASDFAQRNPDHSATRVVIEQLEYLKQVYDRDGNLKSIPKGKMTIGLIAAREYDTEEPKLADLLYKIDWAVDHP